MKCNQLFNGQQLQNKSKQGNSQLLSTKVIQSYLSHEFDVQTKVGNLYYIDGFNLYVYCELIVLLDLVEHSTPLDL